MKFTHKLVIAVVLALFVLITLGADESSSNRIQITAKRFAFVPDKITVKKGQSVTLVLQSQDVTHGLSVKELGIKTEIPKGRPTIISFIPAKTGTFQGQCSHFCGSGHGSMKFTVVVTE